MLYSYNSRQYFVKCVLLPRAIDCFQWNFLFSRTHSKMFLMNWRCNFIIQNGSLVAITTLTHLAYRNDPSYLSPSWIISTVCNYPNIAWTFAKVQRTSFFERKKRIKWNVKDMVEIKECTEWSMQCKKNYTISLKKERLSLEIWWGYGKNYFNQVLISFHTLLGPHCKLPNKECFTKTLWMSFVNTSLHW